MLPRIMESRTVSCVTEELSDRPKPRLMVSNRESIDQRRASVGVMRLDLTLGGMTKSNNFTSLRHVLVLAAED